MNEQLLATMQKQIDELTKKLATFQSKLEMTSKLAFGNADALSKIIPATNQLDRRTWDLHEQDVQLSRRLNKIYRAHNRHVLSTVAPKQQATGWARNRARDLRTWAKPKGWRL